MTTSDTTQTPDTATLTPEAAKVERAHLFADASWRDRAMVPNSREYANLQRLDLTIAGISDDEQAAAAEVAPATPQLREEGPPTDHLNPPTSADGYDFSGSNEWAKSQGIESDPKVEGELRKALHAAGVDSDLAGAAYMVAVHASANPPTDEQVMRQRAAAEHRLQGLWGASYEENVALANEEGRKLFDALPASVKGQRDYATFMVETGIGNSASVIERLAERALARSK